MPSFSIAIDEAAEIIGGKFIHKAFDDQIDQISIDSRRINKGEGLLFFAIKGDNNDGHQYIAELIEKGVRNFVISEVNAASLAKQEANFILVENGVDALQKMAAFKRKQFDTHFRSYF